MVIAGVGNIVLFCQLLFLVALPYCIYYNIYSFQVISLRALRAMRLRFVLLNDYKLNSYIYSALLVHYIRVLHCCGIIGVFSGGEN